LRRAAARVATFWAVAALAIPPLPAWRARQAPSATAASGQAGSGVDVGRVGVPPGDSVPRLAPDVVLAAPITDTALVVGRIRSSLYAALDSCAAGVLPQRARWQLAWLVADIFEYRVDMSRDLRLGDGFRVLFERTDSPENGVKTSRVLAAEMVLSGAMLSAVRFAHEGSGGGAADYFDSTGRSLRAGFLRAPLEFRRISSVYGWRMHPILGEWRDHKGTDYAAPLGTPVRAIGDGVVIFAGRKGGYGNVVDIRHRNGFISRYGHLLRFAPSTRPGARVEIGKTIAYVGMTGLATGPHLHFEVLVDGVARDPRVALRDRGRGEPVPASDRPAFDRVRVGLLDALTRAPGPVDLATQ
jgi:murein DD-endopeptidase MepM/ murein hydrolase activator NlpD